MVEEDVNPPEGKGRRRWLCWRKEKERRRKKKRRRRRRRRKWRWEEFADGTMVWQWERNSIVRQP